MLAYYFIICIRKESIYFFKRKKLKNLILNYKFFYSQIYLIFCFADENLFNFFIKALNNFLFLSLIKKKCQMVRIILEIQTILQNFLQTADVVSDY